jgi:hypothetical protein
MSPKHVIRRYIVSAVFSVFFALLLTGCTPYRPSAESPPPTWSGASGLETVPGTLRTHSGVLKEGDALFERELRFVRTGVIGETIKVRPPLSGDLIIPEGTKAFAINYKFTGGTQRTTADPVEWFVVLPKGSGVNTDMETVYLFWQDSQTVLYNRSLLAPQTPFDAHMKDPGGTPGPLPLILEKPVEFGRKITGTLRIAHVSQDGIVLEGVVSDGGPSPAITKWDLKKWEPGNKATLPLFGTVLSIVAAPDFRSVSVEIVR